MAIKPYVIFSLHDARYAIASASVVEIFLLPELSPVAEAPPDIVGLLNLHSVYVPVMHLDLRFGHKFDHCKLTDSVIVVESQGFQVGLIVHQVEAVNEIDDRYLQADFDYGRGKIHHAFVQSIINLDDEMITLLNIDNLIRHPEALAELLADHENQETESGELPPGNFYQQYFADASANTQEILRLRAQRLKSTSQIDTVTQLVSLAVVRISDRFFAFDLSLVKEFLNLDLGRITIIPCCPEHIVGNINLRGEILTLVNICQPLNLARNRGNHGTKAIVITANEITLGIVVDEVLDVVDFAPEALKPVPLAMKSQAVSYLREVADYRQKVINVIDLPKLLAEGAMTVELTA
jgi:purine-binding chemotaxis protein CheW